MIRIDQLMQLTCKDCDKVEHCKKPCIFIDKIAGKGKSTRELLPPPEPPDKGLDYKEVLIERQEARAKAKPYDISDIRIIDDVRIRAIAAMSYGHISKHDQARLLSISVRTIERLAGLK